MAHLLPLAAAACASGALGLGLGCYITRNPARNSAPLTQPSAIITTSPSNEHKGLFLTGMPTLPEKMPSAAAVLQWAGWPGYDNIKFREGYVSSFNRQTRNPNWVCEHLCRENLEGGSLRNNNAFSEDTSDPPHLRPKLDDYKGSGFDRGHLVAAADIKFSQEAMNETFLLSNICPQVGEGFNRGYWERMERWCRNLVKGGGYSDVFVLSGPLFLPASRPDGNFYMHHRVLGSPPSVHVPTHFFKVVLAFPTRSAQETLTLAPSPDKSPDAKDGVLVPVSTWKAPERPIAVGAFVVPNQVIPDDTDLNKFEVPLEIVERYSGLHFFPRVPRKFSKHVAGLCSATKCQLPPPFQPKGDKGGGKKEPKIYEIK